MTKRRKEHPERQNKNEQAFCEREEEITYARTVAIANLETWDSQQLSVKFSLRILGIKAPVVKVQESVRAARKIYR